MIGHPGNVVTHHTMARPVLRQFGVGLRHGFRMAEVELEQLAQGFHRPLTVHHDGRMVRRALDPDLAANDMRARLRAHARQLVADTGGIQAIGGEGIVDMVTQSLIELAIRKLRAGTSWVDGLLC